MNFSSLITEFLIALYFWEPILSRYCFVLVCFIPFLDRLSRSKLRIIIELAVLNILCSFIIHIINDVVQTSQVLWELWYLNPFSTVYSYALEWLFYSVVFFYARKTVRDNHVNLFFVCCIAASWRLVHLLFYEFISVLFIHFIEQKNPYIDPFLNTSIRSVIHRSIHAGINIVLLIILGFILYRFVSPYLRSSKPKTVKKLCVIPITLYILYGVYYELNTLISLTISPAYIARINTISFIFITIFTAVSFYVYSSLYRMHSSIEKNAQIEQRLELQGEYYKNIQTHITETKRANHDLRQHLSVIQSHIAAGEIEKLSGYLSKYVESLPFNTGLAFCENFAVNSILQYYFNMAVNENIQFDTKLEVPENMSIGDSDLCIIFGNCVENAIEACRQLDSGRFIKIWSMLKGKMFTVVIENSFDGSIKKDGDRFLSHKHKGEGIGISSVKAVVEKYGESAQFETDGNVFRATVILRVKK